MPYETSPIEGRNPTQAQLIQDEEWGHLPAHQRDHETARLFEVSGDHYSMSTLEKLETALEEAERQRPAGAPQRDPCRATGVSPVRRVWTVSPVGR